MSELGETFRAWREHKKVVKKKDCSINTEKLIDSGIRFESKNNGLHLIISHKDLFIDFWPSTNKWSKRDGKMNYSFAGLLKFLGVNTNE